MSFFDNFQFLSLLRKTVFVLSIKINFSLELLDGSFLPLRPSKRPNLVRIWTRSFHNGFQIPFWTQKETPFQNKDGSEKRAHPTNKFHIWRNARARGQIYVLTHNNPTEPYFRTYTVKYVMWKENVKIRLNTDQKIGIHKQMEGEKKNIFETRSINPSHWWLTFVLLY